MKFYSCHYIMQYKVKHLDDPFDSWILLLIYRYILGCTQYSDCPNKGQNYECIDNFCTCAPGHVLDGEACVGMSANIHLLLYYFSGYIFKVFVCFETKYEQSNGNQEYYSLIWFSS